MLTRREWLGLALHAITLVPGNGWQRLLQPAPGVCEVVLLEIAVAGYRFHDGPSIESRLAPGAPLVLAREPLNPHDSNAIAIRTSGGIKLGYVPRAHNTIPARLLDAGIALRARITTLRLAPAPTWKRVRVAVVVEREDATSLSVPPPERRMLRDR